MKQATAQELKDLAKFMRGYETKRKTRKDRPKTFGKKLLSPYCGSVALLSKLNEAATSSNTAGYVEAWLTLNGLKA